MFPPKTKNLYFYYGITIHFLFNYIVAYYVTFKIDYYHEDEQELYVSEALY